MKNYFQIAFILLIFYLINCATTPLKPTDIRNKYLKKGINEADYEKGKALILEMENAYGGKENWSALQKGTKWGIKDGQTYRQKQKEEKVVKTNNKQARKLVYKNYWFQFPFRIGEAPIIAYAGQEMLNGKTYELVYATWGSEKANKKYDQFILYLNPETKLIEYLHFTVREKFPPLSLTAQFDDFRETGPLTLPYVQYIRQGQPKKQGLRFHENHYGWIEFGNSKIGI